MCVCLCSFGHNFCCFCCCCRCYYYCYCCYCSCSCCYWCCLLLLLPILLLFWHLYLDFMFLSFNIPMWSCQCVIRTLCSCPLMLIVLFRLFLWLFDLNRDILAVGDMDTVYWSLYERYARIIIGIKFAHGNITLLCCCCCLFVRPLAAIINCRLSLFHYLIFNVHQLPVARSLVHDVTKKIT